MSRYPASIKVAVKVEEDGFVGVDLGSMPQPLSLDGISQILKRKGYTSPNTLKMSASEGRYEVQVTSDVSDGSFDKGFQINMDQPLIHFYNKCFLEKFDMDPKSEQAEDSKLDTQGVSIGGMANVRFHRTIRVPDNHKTSALPPDMGSFGLFNVADYVDRLPMPVVSKGGVFMGMYQREAMWMSFNSTKPCAIKISVGGINALTGTKQNALSEGKQDYLPVGGKNGQLWLDGIAVAPHVVRQFVATPLGEGHTVEGQLTGKEIEGGVQIDVFPAFKDTVSFELPDGQSLDIYKTPRELGLRLSRGIVMKDLKPRRLNLGKIPGYQSAHILATSVSLLARRIMPREPPEPSRKPLSQPKTECMTFEGPIFHVKTLTGKTVNISWSPSMTIEDLKQAVQDSEGIPPNQQRFIYAGEALLDEGTLSDCFIPEDADVYLVLRLRGGGGPFHGFGAGGRISQKINKDSRPPRAYDGTKSVRLHITVINALYFTKITGLPCPESPISVKTYLENNFPWFELYDEHIPTADNTTGSNPLASVRSLRQIEHDKKNLLMYGSGASCFICCREITTVILQPCGHRTCDDCSTVTKCPSCKKTVKSRKRFAAPMSSPDEEDGVEADSLDARTVKLKYSAKRGIVTSFKLNKHDISPLSGEWKLKTRSTRRSAYIYPN